MTGPTLTQKREREGHLPIAEPTPGRVVGRALLLLSKCEVTTLIDPVITKLTPKPNMRPKVTKSGHMDVAKEDMRSPLEQKRAARMAILRGPNRW